MEAYVCEMFPNIHSSVIHILFEQFNYDENKVINWLLNTTSDISSKPNYIQLLSYNLLKKICLDYLDINTICNLSVCNKYLYHMINTTIIPLIEILTIKNSNYINDTNIIKRIQRFPYLKRLNYINYPIF